MLGEQFEVRDVTSYPDLPEIEETGTTFLENARLKALGISRLVAGWVLSDDSGLEVDALGGAPGVYSSSYGGEEGNNAKNNARLMAEMANHSQRSARFLCTMVLAKDGHEASHFTGVVEGHLLDSLRGAMGFGYDPLFIPEGYESTFAELGSEVKNKLSHRARALEKAVAYLQIYS